MGMTIQNMALQPLDKSYKKILKSLRLSYSLPPSADSAIVALGYDGWNGGWLALLNSAYGGPCEAGIQQGKGGGDRTYRVRPHHFSALDKQGHQIPVLQESFNLADRKGR